MINIIGTGNVASHLYEAFRSKSDVKIINPHTLADLDPDCDLILICVKDNVIPEVAQKLRLHRDVNAIVVHTAGSVPMETLKDTSLKIGVFYPLQTFSKGIVLDYSRIPVFIEASSEDVAIKLEEFASLFSEQVKRADSKDRAILHLASVFACNFTNAMAGIAHDILRESGLDYKVILPLMKQTVDKLLSLSPEEAQTGPASRGDSEVIQAHLKMLENRPEIKDIYSTLSGIITAKTQGHES